MSTAKRDNEPLWQKVKAELLKKNDNQWSARLSQQCVQEYKRRGGGYIGKKEKDNSLATWTRQDWQYAGEPEKSRYLPKKVIDALPPSLKKKENKTKGSKLGQRVPYSDDLKEVMRKKRVY